MNQKDEERKEERLLAYRLKHQSHVMKPTEIQQLATRLEKLQRRCHHDGIDYKTRADGAQICNVCGRPR